MKSMLDVLKNTVRSMEWCGRAQGPGSGFMDSGGDGRFYACCPACGGGRERNGDFVDSWVGHRPECPIVYLLNYKGGDE